MSFSSAASPQMRRWSPRAQTSPARVRGAARASARAASKSKHSGFSRFSLPPRLWSEGVQFGLVEAGQAQVDGRDLPKVSHLLVSCYETRGEERGDDCARHLPRPHAREGPPPQPRPQPDRRRLGPKPPRQSVSRPQESRLRIRRARNGSIAIATRESAEFTSAAKSHFVHGAPRRLLPSPNSRREAPRSPYARACEYLS
jgi:hypothetical protein